MMRGLQDFGEYHRGSASSRFHINQSIMVSGTSGSGKTVVSTHIMKYLAVLSYWISQTAILTDEGIEIEDPTNLLN